MRGRKAPELRRRRHTREPKRRFILYCEGANTEPAYFTTLKRIYRAALIEIETVGAVGVPYTVAQRATEGARELGLGKRRRKTLNSFEEDDQVWALFDRDEHPRFAEAVQLCEGVGVLVGRSNPCFEIWLILHEEEFDRPDGSRAVQAHLQRLRPEYDRAKGKILNYEDLMDRVQVAEARAETQLVRRRDEGAPYGPPSTTVGALTSAIREAAELAR